jgi:SnoaL-like domain
VTTLAEVDAGVRAAIAAYTHALDDGRTDDLVALFCPDGRADMPGLGTPSGHDALRAAYTRFAPRSPQRHLVLNTLLTDWSAEHATAVSDVVFLLHGDTGWVVTAVGRYTDTLRNESGAWRFESRTARFTP